MVCAHELTMKHISTDHIHFFVTDLDAAIEFYKDLGFEFIHKLEHGGREAAQLRSTSGLMIDLNKTRASDNPGYSHYAMLVDEVEKTCQGLKAKARSCSQYAKQLSSKSITRASPPANNTLVFTSRSA